MWVVDRITGKVTLRDVVVADEDDQGATLALRAVELLRASLMEVRSSHPSRGEVEPSRAVEELVGRAEPHGPAQFELEVGGALSWSPGGLGVAWHVAIAFAWMPHPLIGAHVWVLLPVAPAIVSGPEGEADIFPGLAGAGLRFRWVPDPALELRADVGVAAAMLAMSGRGIPPFVGRTDEVFFAAPYVRVAGAWAFTQLVRLRADLTLGVATPGAAVEFAGREAATWGQPLLVVGLGLDVALE